MEFWTYLKTWQKVVVVIFVTLLLLIIIGSRGANSGAGADRGPSSSDAFYVGRESDNVFAYIQCINPNVPRSGLELVYRDAKGKLLTNHTYKTYWGFTNNNKVLNDTFKEEATLEGVGDNEFTFIERWLAILAMGYDEKPAAKRFQIVFSIGNNLSEAKNKPAIFIEGVVMNDLIKKIITTNQCFSYSGE